MRQAFALHQACVDYGVLFPSAAWATSIYGRSFSLSYNVPNALDGIVITWLHVLIFGSVIALVWASSFVQKAQTIRSLGILGGITYPLYLVHQTIGSTVSGYVVEVYAVPRGPIVLCVETLMIGIAYGAYRKDRQFQTWLQSKLRRQWPGERWIVPHSPVVTPMVRS